MQTFFLTILCSTALALGDQPRVLDEAMQHLRIEGPREWAEFPQKPAAARWEVEFDSPVNDREWTLSLRQQDVKQTWNAALNGRQLGRLTRDENDMRIYFSVPAAAVVKGRNKIVVEQSPRGRPQPDDIRVGQITLYPAPREEVLGEAMIRVVVTDEQSGEPLPARITIVDSQGALQTTGAVSNEHLAVRPGVIYTSTGTAEFGVPAGRYTIYAGRGFEYSLASVEIEVAAGDDLTRRLTIEREVPTAGYVACDTHVHTLTHSGHGDATVQERMITLAAEGIELPIATDHNVHVDHERFALDMKVRRRFTPVIGNEVTTRIGHFNIFPVRAGAKTPDHKLDDWGAILDDIYRTPDVKIAILNHGRDLHGGTRPLGPKLFNRAVGENLAGWSVRFNAMEVVNSGATQSDPLQLFHDWMALLNRGRSITPVGSSDSHDVARHFVGQGRTYIRCRDDDPGAIDVNEAVVNFVQGRVMVSYGLIAELVVEEKYRSGELARVPDDEVDVAIRVLAPHWIDANEVTLYANGQRLKQWKIDADSPADLPRGVKWSTTFALPKPAHDVHLVAIATGPGVDGYYWRTAKPYQPTSPIWKPVVIGCSGAVWLDVDGDGRRTSAHEYARRSFAAADGKLAALLAKLKPYDAAVAAQAAHLVQSSGESLLAEDAQTLWRGSAEKTHDGFGNYLDAWRESQLVSQE